MTLPEPRVIAISAAMFPRLHAPDKVSKKFGVSVHYEDLDKENRHVFAGFVRDTSEGVMVRISSRFQPFLYGLTEDNSDLRNFKLRLSDAGISLSAALAHQPMELYVRFYKNMHRDAHPTFVPMLHSIRFNPGAIKLPKFGQTLEDVRPELPPNLQQAFEGM